MSWQLRLLLWQMRLLVKPRLTRVSDPEIARRDFERTARWVFRAPPYLNHVQSSDTLHWIRVGTVQPGRIILFFHGGGYVVGSPSTHAAMLGRLSKLAGLEVCAPHYRLGPEHPLPAAFEDACAAWTRLIELGFHPNQIVLAGDSAGGGLALALLSHLCRSNMPPAGTMVMSPWTDLTLSGETLVSNRQLEPLFPVSRIQDLAALCLGDADAHDPAISPLFGDFPGCPPVLIQYGMTEILRSDSERMAARLQHFGGAITVEPSDHAPHVWHLLDGWIPEARKSLKSLAGFAGTCLDQAADPANSR